MVCLMKKRNKFYKKTLLDVWGYHKMYKKVTKLMHFMKIIRDHSSESSLLFSSEFVFNFKRSMWFSFKKSFKYKYMAHSFLYNFYLMMSSKNYMKYKMIASKKSGYFVNNYITFIEGSLFMLMYSANFVNNMFKLKFMMDSGLFLVNGVKQYYSNYNTKVGDLMQVGFKHKSMFMTDLMLSLNYKNVLWSPKSYLFVNYKFLFIFFLSAPKMTEMKYPISIDIYKGGDMYFL